jgi:hypothetical protein
MYVLIYLAKGELPWQGLKAKNKHDKNSMIMDSKSATPESLLCSNLPCNFFYQFLPSTLCTEEFLDVMLYVKNLEFEEKPNYEMIRGKFKQALLRIHPNKKDEL